MVAPGLCCVRRVSAIFYPSSKVYRDQRARGLIRIIVLSPSHHPTLLRGYPSSDPPVKCFVVHLVQASLPTWSHPSLGGPPLLVPQFPLCALVAEDLDLAVAPVCRGLHDVGARVVEGVDLHMEGQALHALLGAEVRGETLHSKVHFGGALQGVPVDGQSVVGKLFNVANQA